MYRLNEQESSNEAPSSLLFLFCPYTGELDRTGADAVILEDKRVQNDQVRIQSRFHGWI